MGFEVYGFDIADCFTDCFTVFFMARNYSVKKKQEQDLKL
jgi:hypothetical protein